VTTHVGSAIADGASVTIPAHQAGDLLVIFANRFDSTTIPTLPSGWTIAKAKTLLTSGRRIMLRGHGERDRDGVTHAARDLLFRPVGELQIVRPAPGVPLSWRRITFDWVAQ